MTKHQATVAFMRDHLGAAEYPAGSNTGMFVRECQAATWLPGTRWPWCVAAIVRAWTVAGFNLPYRGAGAYAMLAWYQKHLPGWVVPLAAAKPGAAVVFNIGAGHAGILEQPYLGGEYVHTIDGNWSDKVSRVAHKASEVRGVVDPVESQVPVPAKPRMFEVVTSASGHTKVVYVSGSKAISRKLGQILNRWGGVTIRRRRKGHG